MIINEILVEATGVELFSVLTARKLLILGTATTAKKAPLPDPLYVYCTKMLFVLEATETTLAKTVSHGFAGMDREKAPAYGSGWLILLLIALRFKGLTSRLVRRAQPLASCVRRQSWKPMTDARKNSSSQTQSAKERREGLRVEPLVCRYWNRRIVC
jgi:hypothetical protein